MSRIEGKAALVTGANRGIGRAFVEELLAVGARKVYAAARNPETLADLVARGDGRVVPLALDVTKPEMIDAAAVGAAMAPRPPIWLWVPSAGSDTAHAPAIGSP